MTALYSPRGFSLIELLVVLLIVALLCSIAFTLPSGTDRGLQVLSAAEELAAVLRETRSRAIRNNRTYAVAFNIQNEPGSSGRILNNRSGGHWYRVIGPANEVRAGNQAIGGRWDRFLGKPPLFDVGVSPLNGIATYYANYPLSHYLEWVERCWIDEPHVLPKGKVRFLALTDQDNGDNDLPGLGGHYSATYPRPWFGWWDAGTQQLHTWGGYDPSLRKVTQYTFAWRAFWTTKANVNGRDVSHTGFYYEGYDGEISGCRNPIDRKVLDDANRDGLISAAEVAMVPKPLYTVLKQGEPRPLVNAKWLDFIILFHADGSVETDWFRMRNGHGGNNDAGEWNWRKMYGGNTSPAKDPYVVPSWPWQNNFDLGLADMSNSTRFVGNMADPYTNSLSDSRAQREATDYVARTGFYWITLAPDARDDTATFPSAEAALRSIAPLYRVGVSPDGEVQVLRVKPNNDDPTRTFDMTITGADWEQPKKIWGKPGASSPTLFKFSEPVTAPHYTNHLLWEANGMPRGEPVFDTVMPEMLRDRKWWWAK